MFAYNILSEPECVDNDLEDTQLNAVELEELLLASEGFIVNKNVWVYDVALKELGGHIHTIEAGRGNKETIVFIHGYGATGVFYSKIMAQLAKHFRVFAID